MLITINNYEEGIFLEKVIKRTINKLYNERRKINIQRATDNNRARLEIINKEILICQKFLRELYKKDFDRRKN